MRKVLLKAHYVNTQKFKCACVLCEGFIEKSVSNTKIIKLHGKRVLENSAEIVSSVWDTK